MADIKSLELFAWVGEDELSGDGKIGIKQAFCPAGYIPMVAIDQQKMLQKYIVDALDKQGKKFGKKIVLCKFTFECVVQEVGHLD